MQTSSTDDRLLDAAQATYVPPAASVDVVVAGHICLDIIPKLGAKQSRPEDLFVPGGLVHIGPAMLALGGCVANTGLALHRLGAKTRCVGKVGDDLLGKAILESLRAHDPALPEAMVVAPGEATSYTIVLSPPNVDRSFLHCQGANDTFVANDLHESCWRQSRILHFGYPPLMRSIVADAGRGLAQKFAAVQAAGALVTLDMAMPAAGSDAAPVDWRQWLGNVLPHVDVFLPSYDELGVMLADEDEPRHAPADIDTTTLARLAEELLGLGVPIVVIKLGDQGLYLRSSDQVAQLANRAAWRTFSWLAWQNREILAPCFNVEVIGTTGSGDCTIAGFLMGLLQGYGPEAALRSATAVGAYCVQSADATSNIPPWVGVADDALRTWTQREPQFSLDDWRRCATRGVYLGPADAEALARTM